MESRRDRHKAERRQAISDAATRLFEARGFEAVSLADIADAADVSVKTIWNHFGSKEELFFDAEDAVLAFLVDAVRARPAGVSPTGALAPFLDGPILAGPCRWSQMRGDLYDRIRAFAACERASPTLSARRLAILHSWTAPLAAASGSPAWAAMVTGVLALRHDTIITAFVEGRSARTIERRTRAALDPAIAALSRAFPD
ncbi:hypothetical protein DSM104299_01760 [Baekduia alba]|uniref:TetR/AcrR family transcriptional regulator n=1 Tax=Baekduia alba TaxID=2997333 RepID=UPI00234227F4|nr:TetR/AcrR family transcriptional regulator [Baekduia alba]WCB93058.1 hypothetical protein DSM104299_01760 [Baekduia alba]